MIHFQHRTVRQQIAAAELRDKGPADDLRFQFIEKRRVDVPLYNENITALRGCAPGTFRGVSYNASMTDLIGMMNIGSVSVTLMD